VESDRDQETGLQRSIMTYPEELSSQER